MIGNPLPPRDLEELSARAYALSGRSLEELAHAHARSEQGPMVRRKGKTGELIEYALGAHAGSSPLPDFAHLGVELKTLPLGPNGKPRESTFVCAFSLRDAEHAEWHSSGVRRKLMHVLFVPIEHHTDRQGAPHRQIGRPFFWRPSREQESILRADFDDLMGLIALGHIETLSAKLGRWLQVRPKAAHGGVRTHAYGFDDEPIRTIPRGFYLRARFTASLLRDPASIDVEARA